MKIRLNLIQLTKTFINKSFAIENLADLIDENFHKFSSMQVNIILKSLHKFFKHARLEYNLKLSSFTASVEKIYKKIFVNEDSAKFNSIDKNFYQ